MAAKLGTGRIVASLESERLQIGFFELGVNYYLVGRFAFLRAPSTVGVNSLHHAVEMFLKGMLAHHITIDELRNGLGHDLEKAWKLAKSKFSGVDLTEFDATIAKLHRFELIRYPDIIVREGANISMGLFSGDDDIGGQLYPPPNPATTYRLALEDVDKLIKRLFELSNNNPPFYLNRLRAEARAILTEQNLHSLV